MTLLKSSFTSGLLELARLPLAADYNPRSSSPAYQRRNRSPDNYVDDVQCEMSLCALSGPAYSTFCCFFITIAPQWCLHLDAGENVKSSQTGGFRKAAGKVNCRWPFKQCGHMAKRWSPVNPPQLLWYASWVPTVEPRAGFLLLQAFLQLMGHKAASRAGRGPDSRVERLSTAQGGGPSVDCEGPRRYFSSLPRGPVQSCWPCSNAEAICGPP